VLAASPEDFHDYFDLDVFGGPLIGEFSITNQGLKIPNPTLRVPPNKYAAEDGQEYAYYILPLGHVHVDMPIMGTETITPSSSQISLVRQYGINEIGILLRQVGPGLYARSQPDVTVMHEYPTAQLKVAEPMYIIKGPGTDAFTSTWLRTPNTPYHWRQRSGRKSKGTHVRSHFP
jgi:hypothetical protein